jgi:hypothetical protein
MMTGIMIGFTLILFPFVVLGFVLLMERVEEPLNHLPNEREIEQFLDSANTSELDTFVREGSESALRRFRGRLGIGRRRGRRKADPAALD